MIFSKICVLFLIVEAALGRQKPAKDRIKICGVSDRNRLRCQDNHAECWTPPAQCRCLYGNNPTAYPNCPSKPGDKNNACNGKKCSNYSSCKQSKCICRHKHQQHPNCCRVKCTKAGYECRKQKCIKVKSRPNPTDIVSTWTAWSAWSSCSSTCGSGSQSRSRECPGSCIGGSGSEKKTCTLQSCRIRPKPTPPPTPPPTLPPTPPPTLAPITKPGTCTTTSGKACVFPYSFMGRTYNSCNTADGSATPWCSTKVDAYGFHISNQGHWGDCSSSCPGWMPMMPMMPMGMGGPCTTTSGKPCVFPFTFRGRIYRTCTMDDGSAVPWCSTKTNAWGVHISGQGHWGDCPASCGSGSD